MNVDLTELIEEDDSYYDETLGDEEEYSNTINPNNGLVFSDKLTRKQDAEIKSAKHYTRIGSSTYGFVDDVVDEIPSSFYRPCWDSYNNKAYLEKLEIIQPKLYHLPDKVFETVMSDIQHFWESEEKYKAFGNVYKRNILLYSVPGNGKTSIINLLAKELIEKHNGIILVINSFADLFAYSKNIERLRQIEPNRKIITIVEDFDGIVNQNKDAETFLLQILDGNNQYSNVVTIATTNYVEQLKPSFTDRPSRFNTIIEYKKPNAEVRRYYFENKLKDSGIDIATDEMKAQIDRLVKCSEGFTFDYCKELLELIFVMEYREEEAIERLVKAKEKRGKYTVTENKEKTVGFN